MGSPHCQLIATGDDQKNIMLWRLTNTKPRASLVGQSSEAKTLVFNEKADKLYSGTLGGTAHIWDI